MRTRPASSGSNRFALGLAAAAALSAALSAVPAAADAAILSVDFGSSTNVSTETGFQAFGISETATVGPLSQSYPVSDPFVASGSVTVTLANGASPAGTGNLLSRNRGNPADSGAFTYGEFYRDIAIANPSNAILQLQLSGLNPLTQYDVTLYAYDQNNGGTVTLTDTTAGTTNLPQAYTYAAGSVTSNEQFGRTFRVTSTAGGLANFTSATNFNSNQGLMNGVVITAVPEPSAAAALAVAAVGLLGRRRRGRIGDTSRVPGNADVLVGS